MRNLSSEMKAEIVRAWGLFRSGKAVAQHVGVSAYTARLYRPKPADAKPKPPRKKRDVEGYHTWSQAVRDRWDRFWSGRVSARRLGALLDGEQP